MKNITPFTNPILNQRRLTKVKHVSLWSRDVTSSKAENHCHNLILTIKIMLKLQNLTHLPKIPIPSWPRHEGFSDWAHRVDHELNIYLSSLLQFVYVHAFLLVLNGNSYLDLYHQILILPFFEGWAPRIWFIFVSSELSSVPSTH